MDGPQSSKPVLGCRLRPPAALRCGQRPPSKTATEIPAIVTSSPCSLRRFAFGWSRFGSFSAAGRDVGPVDPFWVFLAAGHFAAKTPADECWIVLDFLGFSRQNLDFSMGYGAFSGKNFSLSLSAGAETPGTGACGLSLRKGRIVHGQA